MGYGQKIIQLRKNAQVTQTQLGDYLNVSAQAVSKWERDTAEPDLGTVKKICEFFKISVGEFFDDAAKSIPAPEEEKAEVAPQEPAQKPVETIGYCVDCGIIVNESNLGMKTPVVLCDKCKDNRRATYIKLQQEKAERISSNIDAIKRKKRKSIIVGSIIAAVVFAILIALVILSGTKDAGTIAIWVAIALFAAYGAYALTGELYFGDGIVLDILEFFIASPIKLPGVIFGLDIGGILFFIFVKILLGILGFLLGVVMFIVGILLGMIVSTVAFPISMAKTNKEIKGLKSDLQAVEKEKQ